MNIVGVDVDSKFLVCQIKRIEQDPVDAQFDNSKRGFAKFVRWAKKGSKTARVCLESTGVYSIPFALFLHEDTSLEVSVVNPSVMKKFADASMQRGKTDKLDAATIRAYAERMPFRAWSPPAKELLELQHICRRVVQLTQEVTRENNRREAALILGDIGKVVANDAAVTVRHLKRRIVVLEEKILQLVKESPVLKEKYELICSVTGIADKTGPRILAELMALPDDMSAKQWVALAGLDPKPKESGSSIHKPRRISKAGNRYLRTALFFPALVAIQRDPNVKAFYSKLTRAGKRPKQAIVAVMRKLLLSIWGILKHEACWDGNKFYLIPNSA